MAFNDKEFVAQLTDLVKFGVDAERQRCINVCESWIGTFQDVEIKCTEPRKYAVGAIEDIIELIRDGHDPRSVAPPRVPV